MKTVLKGILFFTGWGNKPWKLVTEKKDIDLCPLIDNVFQNLNGESVSQDQSVDSYCFKKDDSSSFLFEYESMKLAILKRKPEEKGDGTTLSNVKAHLPMFFEFINGRKVVVEIDSDIFKITIDEKENVHGVYFTSGNSCKITAGDEDTICKIKEKDSCIFISFGGEREGFICDKFDSLAEELLNRFAGHRRGRIGNCQCLGRIED